MEHSVIAALAEHLAKELAHRKLTNGVPFLRVDYRSRTNLMFALRVTLRLVQRGVNLSNARIWDVIAVSRHPNFRTVHEIPRSPTQLLTELRSIKKMAKVPDMYIAAIGISMYTKNGTKFKDIMPKYLALLAQKRRNIASSLGARWSRHVEIKEMLSRMGLNKNTTWEIMKRL